MTRTGRIAATTLVVGAATVGLAGVASASEDGDHHDDDHAQESGDDNPGVLTGVGNLVGGVLSSDLVGNILDGVL